MTRIELSNWNRREIYAFFKGVSQPYYALSFPIDVTAVYDYKRAHGISFYYMMVYLCTKAINSIENFRYTERNGQIFLLDERRPSATDACPETGLFKMVTFPMQPDAVSFCHAAREISAAQTNLLNASDEGDDLIFFSSLPDLPTITYTNPHNYADPHEAEHNIPSVNWGQYVESNGRKTLNLTMEINHRFVDGHHAALFYKRLQAEIEGLEM